MTYFHKPYNKPFFAESAMLIQMIPAPKNFNPVSHPVVAEQRQKALLERYQRSG